MITRNEAFALWCATRQEDSKKIQVIEYRQLGNQLAVFFMLLS